VREASSSRSPAGRTRGGTGRRPGPGGDGTRGSAGSWPGSRRWRPTASRFSTRGQIEVPQRQIDWTVPPNPL